ncbi:MAG: GIY-YIG nuclease family protein [Candidatus Nanopelagicales bacterium]
MDAQSGTPIPAPGGDLNMGHILTAAGATNANDFLMIRHTYKDDGLRMPSDLTLENVLAYTREQDLSTLKFPADPPPTWLIFMADGGRRSRFYGAFENRGELVAERTSALRTFDLYESGLLSSLKNRLVIEWSKDAINWTKTGIRAWSFPVVEIADPEVVQFPGFDRVRISYGELQAVVQDSRYASWRTALGSVQGIYVIADTSSGKLYVGKADGGDRILGRWNAYARDGHGGNVALKELAGADSTRANNYVFSLLRVFGPNATAAEVDEAEAHYKQALLTRVPFGLNLN